MIMDISDFNDGISGLVSVIEGNDPVKSLSYQAGIYDTEVTLINHRDGSTSIKYGYVKWTGNTGTLQYKKRSLSGDQAKFAKLVFNGSVFESEFGDKYVMGGAELIGHLGFNN